MTNTTMQSLRDQCEAVEKQLTRVIDAGGFPEEGTESRLRTTRANIRSAIYTLGFGIDDERNKR